MPVAWALDRVDQWVAPAGLSSNVLTITRFDLVVGDAAGMAGAILVQETIHPLGHEPPPPLPDRGFANPQPRRRLPVGDPGGAGHHDPGSQVSDKSGDYAHAGEKGVETWQWCRRRP
jgi:hypothetical protein